MSDRLHDPAEHRPLAGREWADDGARAAIAEIASVAVDAYRGPERLWANHPDDLEGAEDRPLRSVYLGAAGTAWGLHRLARDGLGPPLPGLGDLAAVLHADFLAAPELTDLETGAPPPPPSLLFGESGILLALEAIAGTDGTRRDALHDCVVRNADNPTRELCWGTPGTLLAAAAMGRASGEARWCDRVREGADRLLAEWGDPVWDQDMYGERRRYVGAGHGFASNAAVLLSRDEPSGAVVDRVVATVVSLASEEGPLAQWPALADAATERRPVQWCHGAPGIVTALGPVLPADPDVDRLLVAGGELTWRAGPLRKGVGLCHGTAGNGFALLELHHRTGDERWLHRARAFAMDAAADVAERRARHGFARHPLFTGDLGPALLLRACLQPERRPAFPFLGDALG